MASSFPQFLHHGAADGVTGSCHRYVASPRIHLLVDCGLFQGREAGDGQAIDFDLALVRALIVTHVHIDHIGRLPYLLAAGFKGPILCSAPSVKLLPLVIEDAFKIGFTRDKKLVQQFLRKVQKRLLPLAYKRWYPLVDTAELQLRVRLQRAGHILGSAYVEIDLKHRAAAGAAWLAHRTVFSGDLGAPHAPLLPAPKPPHRADTLVIESTYGNRVHEDRKARRLRLKALVEKALGDGGSVLIPAFSIGRTQELLYEFESIIHELGVSRVAGGATGDLSYASAQSPTGQDHTEQLPTQLVSTRPGLTGKALAGQAPTEGDVANRVQAGTVPTIGDPTIWEGLAIIVDSPLAAKFTKVYRELKPYWDEEALRRVDSGRHPLDFERLLTIDSHADHMRVVNYLAQTKRPAIVIAASGMAAGGRIVNYLKAMLGDARHNVLFVGYQVPGTPGHQILRSAHRRRLPAGESGVAGREPSRSGSVDIDGERFEIRAGVESIGGYSAHADQHNLLSFVRGMKGWPGQIRIVHGTDEGREGLRRALLAMGAKANKTFELVLPGRA